MNPELKGGASRPRRRRVFSLGVLVFLAAILLVSIEDSAAGVFSTIFDEEVAGGQLADPDSAYARQLIEAVRGANGVLCGALDRSFDTGYGGHSLTSIIESDFADPNSIEISRWVNKREYDETVLPVIRRGLSSSDACVRRIAARVAGKIKGKARLHERLSSELGSSNPATRTAAVFALGFADHKAAIPVVRDRLVDSDRDVRVAAIWALGTIGDPNMSDPLVGLLERDSDPAVRRAAAWALGRLHD